MPGWKQKVDSDSEDDDVSIKKVVKHGKRKMVTRTRGKLREELEAELRALGARVGQLKPTEGEKLRCNWPLRMDST